MTHFNLMSSEMFPILYFSLFSESGILGRRNLPMGKEVENTSLFILGLTLSLPGTEMMLPVTEMTAALWLRRSC